MLRKMSPFFSLVLIVLFFDVVQVYAKKWPVYAKNGMVVTTDRIASEVGVAILRKGGNAIDAAVATGFALAVVHPAAGNIGGGGFMVIRLADGTTVAIDYREKAPKAAHENMYLDENGQLLRGLNHNGYLAIGVPGTIAGFTLALEKFGTMSIKDVIKPAIRLANKGFPVSYSLSRGITFLAETFKKYPASAKVFLKNGSEPYEQWGTTQDSAEKLQQMGHK
ncbi:MAG: gamma-glutamyltransferase, partial [bacterium]